MDSSTSSGHASSSTGRPSLLDRGLLLAFVYPAFFVPYGLVNRSIAVESGRNLTTELDRLTPFVPEFMYLFYLAYALPALGLFIGARHRLLAAAGAVAALIAGSCIIFAVFPVTVPRPEALPDTLAGRLVATTYAADRPVCGFPSLHVSMSFLTALIVVRERRLVGVVAMVFCALTSVAVLFVKQHVVADVLGGLAIAGACYWLYRRLDIWLFTRTRP